MGHRGGLTQTKNNMRIIIHRIPDQKLEKLIDLQFK